MTVKKVVVDTDIMLEHLLGSGRALSKESPSFLRRLMSECFCYTTVFNAIELFSLCKTSRETAAVEKSLYAMKILGLNSKSAKNIGPLVGFARAKRTRDIDTLVAGLCIESRLPLVTNSKGRYSGMRGLEVVSAGKLLKNH